ncbi:DUF2407 C-terminal domain-containing protein [Halteromyces radiatus]|uniref:DUF2407 C-terminal domain-containing protein n=1 Tax=Halteromyces radiatus TaxID=101107 RepID=UPI0022202183|nr:DUF2407 C-terminal domain-containing protein [Halteromyces radiatus]KAI8092860.1 DUF2407 C-terminal domain-containing protein [Halteromyces radiatus]
MTSTIDNILIYIRWTEGSDLPLHVAPFSDTPANIKNSIYQVNPNTTNKKLRLIYNGKILDNDSKPLNEYGLQISGSFIHCVVSDHVPVNCSKSIKRKTDSIRGFDRLLNSGFNQEEIRSIRTQFHRMHQTPYDGQEPTEQLLQFEEQWMDQTGETVPEGTIQGTYKEMMWGLMLGFFLGILCVFWVRESVFTRRHQLGILAGMFLNVSFGYMHVYH